MATQPIPTRAEPAPAPKPGLLARPFFEDKARAFWLLQAAGWSGYLVLRMVSGVSNNPTLEKVVPIIIEAIVGYCLTLLLSTLYGYYRRRLPRIAGILAVIATLIAATILYAILQTLTFPIASLAEPDITAGRVLGYSFLTFTVLAGWSALYFGINWYLIVEDQIDQMRRLETQASSAQLAMLRYQLNPHFLFNTLNSISTLVLLKQTDKANAMLSRLSSFLRYTLANEPTASVTLAQEVETLKLYLEIEKMRFEERLRTRFDIDPRTVRARLPSLLLQPLVENAIKYAVTPQESGADIAISARLAGERVQIAVSDTGPGLIGSKMKPSLSTGVGLANIRERLVQAFGPDHRFTTGANPKGGFRVEIDIPFQFEEPTREAA